MQRDLKCHHKNKIFLVQRAAKWRLIFCEDKEKSKAVASLAFHVAGMRIELMTSGL